MSCTQHRRPNDGDIGIERAFAGSSGWTARTTRGAPAAVDRGGHGLDAGAVHGGGDGEDVRGVVRHLPREEEGLGEGRVKGLVPPQQPAVDAWRVRNLLRGMPWAGKGADRPAAHR